MGFKWLSCVMQNVWLFKDVFYMFYTSAGEETMHLSDGLLGKSPWGPTLLLG